MGMSIVYIQQLRNLSSYFMQFNHCFREANPVTDALSNVGCLDSRDTNYEVEMALSKMARSAIRMDRL